MELRQYCDDILMSVLPKKIHVLFPPPPEGIKEANWKSYCFTRLLNINKEMPKTIRDFYHKYFLKVEGEKKKKIVVFC